MLPGRAIQHLFPSTSTQGKQIMAGNPFQEAMLRTLTSAFSPQIVQALGEVLAVVKAYDERVQRIEVMVELLVLRSGGNQKLVSTVIDEVHNAAGSDLYR